MKRSSLDTVLGLLAALLFLATRLIGLERWPIYFFFPFDPAPTGPVKTLRLEVKDLNAPGDTHLHVHEIKLKEVRWLTLRFY